MWASLSRDLFSLIVSNDLDGRDIARCARVCRHWRHLVTNTTCAQAAALRRLHVIKLSHINDLTPTLAMKRGVKRRDRSSDRDMLHTLLFYDYAINPFLISGWSNATGDARNMFARLLQHVNHLDGTDLTSWSDEAGNVCTISYFSSPDFVKEWKKLYERCDVESLEELSAFFNGCFTWRYIMIPAAGVSSNLVNMFGYSLRGSCVQFIFKSKGVITDCDFGLMASLESKSLLLARKLEKRQKVCENLPAPLNNGSKLVNLLEKIKQKVFP